MSFFKASTAVEDVKSSSSNHITSSGIYPVTILAPVVSVSKNGATTVDMFVDHEGQQQIIYGNLRVTNNDGGVNKIGNKLFNQLLVVAGVEEVSDPVDVELPIGKGGADKPAAVLEDLMDVEVLMRIQMEYGVWQGNITEKKNIRAFFRAEDNASAEEIVQEKGYGEAYKKEEKYIDAVTYKDGLTEESVQEWISAQRPKGTGGGASTAKAAPSFGKKRFGK